MYVYSLFPSTVWLWNSLSGECFPLTYDLNGLKSRVNRHHHWVLSNKVLCKYIFVFLVKPCYMEAELQNNFKVSILSLSFFKDHWCNKLINNTNLCYVRILTGQSFYHVKVLAENRKGYFFILFYFFIFLCFSLFRK